MKNNPTFELEAQHNTKTCADSNVCKQNVYIFFFMRSVSTADLFPVSSFCPSHILFGSASYVKKRVCDLGGVFAGNIYCRLSLNFGLTHYGRKFAIFINVKICKFGFDGKSIFRNLAKCLLVICKIKLHIIRNN